MKKRRFFPCLLFLLAVILLMPASIQAASAPGTVKLNSISAPAYNKINVKWKKTSSATHYIVYYKKEGTKKWTKIKTLDNSKSSYTHTSSKKYPIVVGQKYTYTVKAYNKKTKKSGSYNKKGLTAYTKPAMVKNIKATYKDGIVTLTWDKAAGADKYLVYRKDNGKWKMLALKMQLTKKVKSIPIWYAVITVVRRRKEATTRTEFPLRFRLMQQNLLRNQSQQKNR